MGFFSGLKEIDRILAEDAIPPRFSEPKPIVEVDPPIPDTIWLVIGIRKEQVDIVKAYDCKGAATRYMNCGAVGKYLKYEALNVFPLLIQRGMSYTWDPEICVKTYKSPSPTFDVEGVIEPNNLLIDIQRSTDAQP